jgi:hypothetical protein
MIKVKKRLKTPIIFKPTSDNSIIRTKKGAVNTTQKQKREKSMDAIFGCFLLVGFAYITSGVVAAAIVIFIVVGGVAAASN